MCTCFALHVLALSLMCSVKDVVHKRIMFCLAAAFKDFFVSHRGLTDGESTSSNWFSLSTLS